MDEQEHSPLPWIIDRNLIRAADGYLIAEMYGYPPHDLDGTPWEANARLIVTSVNSRAELLAAAKVGQVRLTFRRREEP